MSKGLGNAGLTQENLKEVLELLKIAFFFLFANKKLAHRR